MFLGNDAVAAHAVGQHLLENLQHHLFFDQLVGLVAFDNRPQFGFQEAGEAFHGHALFFGGEEIHGVGLGVLLVSLNGRGW